MQISASNSTPSFSTYTAGKNQAGSNPHASDADKTKADKAKNSGNAGAKSSTEELDQQEQQQIRELQQRDREVRAHEAAHKSAAGNLSKGGASFSYQRGPDGRLYAVGGEVSIDTGPVSGDPQATLQKANQIRAAALAPAKPSSQDRAVAAGAAIMASEARNDIAAERREETQQLGSNKPEEKNENSTDVQHYDTVANNTQNNSDTHTIDLMA